MWFRVLGPLEVLVDGGVVELRGAVQRSVLAYLLLHANEVVATEQLVDALWGDAAPDTAPKMVQNAVSKLRGVRGLRELLTTRPRGYLLQVDPATLDLRRFEQLVGQARAAFAAGDFAAAESAFLEAEALWRGPALADVAAAPFVQVEAARLEEMRLGVVEQRVDAALERGRHAELTAELEALVALHPLRETLRMQLMVALYRSGRQAEALDAYRQARRFLHDELGIEPSPALQRLERAILVHDPSLERTRAAADGPDVEAAATTAARAARKTVTALSVQLRREGRPLDPEALAEVTRRVEERVAAVVRDHDGTLQPGPRDAVTAVFGVPALREDDTVRALRAAIEIRRAISELNAELDATWAVRLAIGIGVGTGDVLDTGAGLAGDVLSGAPDLARAATDGSILLDASAARVLRGAVRTEPLGDGTERLVELYADAAVPRRRLDAPFVGRDRELSQLRAALELVADDATSCLVTVLGPAGIGKSRLAREFVGALGDEATVLVGRCLAHGSGVTFWPLAEVVRSAAGSTSRDAVLSLVAGDPDAERIADRIAGAIGSAEPAASALEVFWAAAKLFAAVARDRPLVLVFEDIHWAEPTFLDLLDHLAGATRDARLFLLCLARSELLDVRPTWGGGKLNASTILLQPLSPEASEQLVANAGGSGLSPAVLARISETAEGNPLFIEQMVAMELEEDAGGERNLPPTIQALLAARIDRLDPSERTALECASVVGREFSRDAVAELARASGDAVDTWLDALQRRDLIGAAPSPTAVRFRHALIREVAYERIPKRERAELHERFARYLERTPEHPEREYDEIRGFHLAAAAGYRRELGIVDDETRALARSAAELLASAGRRAYARDDVPAAVALLSRAAELLEDADPLRVELLPDLGEAVRESGDYARGESVLAEAVAAAAAAGDERLEAYARIVRMRMRVQTAPDLSASDLLSEAQAAIQVFERHGDGHSLGKAWELLAWGRWLQCDAAATEEALQRSLAHARRSGDSRTVAQSLHLLLGATLFGALPVPEAIARCERILHEATQQRVTASALRALAALKAMDGDFDSARALLRRFASTVSELGLRVTAASAAETYGVVELLAGDPAAAERELREGIARLEEMGETSTRANLAAILAQALHAQGRDEEAVAVTELTVSDDDVSAQVHLRAARAKVLARVGRVAEAEQLGRDAVVRAETTNFVGMRADALADLAEVLEAAGRPGEAVPLLTEALRLYELKQHVVNARKARASLAALTDHGGRSVLDARPPFH